MIPVDDSGNESDSTCEKCHNRVCPIGRIRKKDDWVGCEICLSWFHSKCVGVINKSLGDDPYFGESCSK